jgi:pimeloyl-ACP methyl ester carboxylesterase
MGSEMVNQGGIQSGKTTLDQGVTLSYVLSEEERRETILFIHGVGGSKKYLLPALDYPELTSYNVLIPDLVGHGDSSTPKNFSFSMDDQAKILHRLLKKLEIRDKLILIAHSMGGPICISLAEMLGDRIAGIVYAEGNIDIGDCFFTNWVISDHTYEEWIKEGFDNIIKQMMEDPKQRLDANMAQKAGSVTIYKASEEIVAVSKADTLKDRLVDLDVPVLVVFGEENRGKFTSEAKLGSIFPLVFIPEAGHSLMEENPDAFYGEVIKFIGTL